MKADKNKSNRRVLFFLDTFLMGGAEKQAILLADYFHNILKYEVEVWAIDRTGKGSEMLSTSGVKWKLFPLNRYAGKFKRVSDLAKLILAIRKFKPDVIMPYTYWPNVLTNAIWKLTGSKCCTWNQRDEGRGITGHLLERLAFKYTSAMISNSEEGRVFLAKHLAIAKSDIHLIHNAVVLSEPLNSKVYWQEKLEINDSHFVACMLANLHGYKDHSTLLKAWKSVVDETNHKTPLLLLAGRFDHKYEELKAEAEQLGISKNVRFLGQVDDVSGILTVVNLGVFSSKFEGCPNGVLECMAAKLPVVATSIIGIKDALGDSYPYLADMGNAETFAEYIMQFINNESLRVDVGLMNFKRVETHFSINKMTLQYKLLLDSLLD